VSCYKIDYNHSDSVTIDHNRIKSGQLNATGKHTVKEYIEETAEKYNGNVPAQLDSFIISELEKLVFEYRIVVKGKE
jgi:hypothetical protein